MYYVYAYLRKDGTPYYIGKGKDRRAYAKNHNLNIPTDKSRIVFLETNLTDIGALIAHNFTRGTLNNYICKNPEMYRWIK